MYYAVLAGLSSVVAAYAISSAVFPLLRRGGLAVWMAISLSTLAVTTTLFLIPADHPQVRGLAAVFSTDIWLRVVDFARERRASALNEVGWGSYNRFLIPFPILLVVFQKKRKAVAAATDRSMGEAGRAGLGLVGIAIGMTLLFGSQRIELLRSSFALDHLIKVFLFVLTVESLAQAICAIERLGGYATFPIVEHVFLAHTPAEFWRRWNNRVQPWLYWNVFVPSGGRRAPLRGVWAVFFVSGVLHEVMFAIATSKLTGYQLAFFVLQAPAVIASPILVWLIERAGQTGAMIARGVTFIWMASTGVLFFDGVDRVFSWVYVGGRWLP